MNNPLRTVAKAGRSVLVRIFHPVWRRRATGYLARTPPIDRLLFVCLGNVCRSPYAEKRMLDLLARSDTTTRPAVESAGFIKPGRGSPERAVEVAAERQLDLSSHTSRILAQCTADDRTLVVVMEPGQVAGVREEFGADTLVVALGDLDPGSPFRRLIPDPWGHPPEVFRSSFDRIDRCLSELLAHLRRAR